MKTPRNAKAGGQRWSARGNEPCDGVAAPASRRARARPPAACSPRRAKHLCLELGVALAHDRDLQLLARAEVREHARLAHARDLGQGADREPLETDVRRERERCVENGGARLLAL